MSCEIVFNRFLKPQVNGHKLRIRTSFPRFQEYFTLIVQLEDPNSDATTGKMYVGKYFTVKGEFDEVTIL